MRPLLSALLAAGLAGGGLSSAPASGAGDALSETRARLAALYATSATAGREYDLAVKALAEADRAVERERRAARGAEIALAEQSADIAALTVQQLQAQTGRTPLLVSIVRENPRDVLALSSAYGTVADAMAARIDDLSAREAVHNATRRRLERVRDSRREAAAHAAEARATINAAIAESKRATLAAAAALDNAAPDVPRPEAPQPAEPTTAQPPQPPTEDQAAPPATEGPDAAPVPSRPTLRPNEDDRPKVDPPGGDVVWDRIARCESGGNWHINTGNGYYGGLQFSKRTWQGIGGPGLPHEHSREVQIHYAKLLQARYGWDQWSCASARFG